MSQLFDLTGSNRSLKIPLSLKTIKSKKICVNHSKMERDARQRVRNLKKYQRTVERSIGRKLKSESRVDDEDN
jgi:hypothetical protein